ncbi:MAG: magnesium transporter [Alphaproteobacteria bacterium]|nr:magnesium transporter [Alphaproteobacteria bacterium]
MADELARAVAALNDSFVASHPRAAGRSLEDSAGIEAAEILKDKPDAALEEAFDSMTADAAAQTFEALPDEVSVRLLGHLRPDRAVRLLGQLDPDICERKLALLGRDARELRRLLDYPADSAGRMMNTRFVVARGEMTVATARDRLRAAAVRPRHALYVVAENNRLSGMVELGDLAAAQDDARISELALPIVDVVQSTDPAEQVVAKLKNNLLHELPVIDLDGRLLGIIHHSALVRAVAAEASIDIQTMVGASRDERALSPAFFAVRKRLPWLHINLLTAFLAAAVVGAFESTIAKYTALAVLLPVVAGQSGNAGSQALAVTMRGLALREIGIGQWMRVARKEVLTGFINGVAIAVTTGVGVLIWSSSIGLALVIAISMVIAMVCAGFAGALVPIGLTRVGQDPATASSIVLTTVTDIAGFMSFLGIATILSFMLTAG